ncbi:MAG: O-antigen ligase family protein [Hyphomicrobiales bacterium]
MPAKPPKPSARRRTPQAKAAIVAAALLGLALPFQITLEFGGTATRISAADPLLLAAMPFAGLYAWRRRQMLYRTAGAPLLLAAAACTAALTLALFIGHAQIGAWNGWALVKFTGWFVLLAYAGFGMALASAGGAAAVAAFGAGLFLAQISAFAAYMVSLAGPFDWTVRSGPRLQGWADNANAMAMQMLIGLALALGFNGPVRDRAGGVAAIAVPAILAAMVLFTRSVAGLAALPLLLGAAAVWRSVRPGTLVLIVAVASVLWLGPQMISGWNSLNVVEKAAAVLAPRMAAQTKSAGVQTLTVDARAKSYRLALEQWKSRPLTGAGLGTHMVSQKRAEAAAPAVQIHNTPLWLAAETGVLGLGAFSVLVLLLGLRFWRAGRCPPGPDMTRAMAVSALLALGSAVVMSLFHELLYQRMLWAVLGLALAFSAPGADQREPGPRESRER